MKKLWVGMFLFSTVTSYAAQVCKAGQYSVYDSEQNWKQTLAYSCSKDGVIKTEILTSRENNKQHGLAHLTAKLTEQLLSKGFEIHPTDSSLFIKK